MHAVFGGKFRHRALALHGLKRHPRLEARVMVRGVFACSDLLVLGDQQTSDHSFRHCPNFGE
jgi:hypothetical protein